MCCHMRTTERRSSGNTARSSPPCRPVMFLAAEAIRTAMSCGRVTLARGAFLPALREQRRRGEAGLARLDGPQNSASYCTSNRAACSQVEYCHRPDRTERSLDVSPRRSL